MLFFWDHGGALSGFGVDYLNPRNGARNMMYMTEIVNAQQGLYTLYLRGSKDGQKVDTKYNIYPIPATELTANPNLSNPLY